MTNATRRAENECSSAVDILEYETRKTMRCVKKKKKGYVSNIDICWLKSGLTREKVSIYKILLRRGEYKG